MRLRKEENTVKEPLSKVSKRHKTNVGRGAAKIAFFAGLELLREYVKIGFSFRLPRPLGPKIDRVFRSHLLLPAAFCASNPGCRSLPYP